MKQTRKTKYGEKKYVPGTSLSGRKHCAVWEIKDGKLRAGIMYQAAVYHINNK